MRTKEKLSISDRQKIQLRVWCDKHGKGLPIQMYNWLMKSENLEDLRIRKIAARLTHVVGTTVERYNWIKYGTIPNSTLNDPNYPDLNSDPF